MLKRAVRSIIVGTLLLLSLFFCGCADEPAQTDITPTPETAATPFPTPTNTPVPTPVLAELVKLGMTELSMNSGETVQLTPVLFPENCVSEPLTYTTSNDSVLSVDENGLLTAGVYGNAVLTVSAPGGASTELAVTVTKQVSITFSFAGDVTLGSDLINQNTARNFYAVYDRVQDDSYFLKNVLPYFKSDDITLVNLEGTLSDRGERQEKSYAFRGAPAYSNILTCGSVEAVSLGNNHTLDYGKESYEDTVTTLNKAGIAYAKGSEIGYITVKDTKTAIISVYQLPMDIDNTKKLIDSTIQTAKAEGANLITVSFHWGIEKSTNETDIQKTVGHYAIDAGADIVIGHHPHVLQGIERYNGKYIIYSLANFCFGGNTNPQDKDTMIFRQTFTLINDELQPDDNVQVIPCSISSVKELNNYQPTPQAGEEGARIVERLNRYSTEFGMEFEEVSDGIYAPKAD